MSENLDAQERGKGLIIIAYILIFLSFFGLLGSFYTRETGHIYYCLTNYRRIDLIIASSLGTVIGRNIINIIILVFGLIAWRSKKNINGKTVIKISIILILLFVIRELLPF